MLLWVIFFFFYFFIFFILEVFTEEGCDARYTVIRFESPQRRSFAFPIKWVVLHQFRVYTDFYVFFSMEGWMGGKIVRERPGVIWDDSFSPTNVEMTFLLLCLCLSFFCWPELFPIFPEPILATCFKPPTMIDAMLSPPQLHHQRRRRVQQLQPTVILGFDTSRFGDRIAL